MDAELLPCPFCGGPAITEQHSPYFVGCRKRPCTGFHLGMTAEKWNTRADPSPEIAELRAALRKMTAERDSWEFCCRDDAKNNAPCGHHVSLAYSDDGGKHIYCYACKLDAILSTQRALAGLLEEVGVVYDRWDSGISGAHESMSDISPIVAEARAALNLAKGATA